MTDVPGPIWDRIVSQEYICALGRVVYEANRLETVAAGHWFRHAHMAGMKPHLKFPYAGQAMTKTSPVTALIDVLETIEPKTDQVTKRLDWAHEAQRLLHQRHTITHVIYAQFDDPQVIAVHYDRKGPGRTYSTLDDPDDLLKLAAEIFAHRQVGERSDIPGLEEMFADLPSPKPGSSWILLLPGRNPFADRNDAVGG